MGTDRLAWSLAVVLLNNVERLSSQVATRDVLPASRE